jgi:phosphoenolpyruvate-protein phosphotransferase (PTS system enzyme I)
MAGKWDTETRLVGLSISRGVVLAKTCLFRQHRYDQVPDYPVAGEAIEGQKTRLRKAITVVSDHLLALQKVVASRIGPAEAEIFAAQAMIVGDPVLDQMMMETIDAGRNAEAAIVQTFEAYEARLMKLDSAYLRDRASDLGEIKRRLLDVLCELKPSFQCAGEPSCQRGKQRIVITEELTPAAAMELDSDEIMGIVTARGGRTSHAAILARALGIPAVSGIADVHELVSCGTEMIVNGDTGEVIVWPTEQTIALLAPITERAAPEPPPERTEGLRVMANIGVAADVKEALAMKAEGIGLYRTEFEVALAGHLLNEDEQFTRYAAVLAAMDGAPVHFRLFDIGGDKPSPLFDFPREENPALGLRGARFLLARPDLLRPQARALARLAARRPVHVLYPMIVDLDQFRRLRQLFEEAVADLPRGQLHHGVMFEVPSAVLQAREILNEAEFASIGSNDLVQYLFAVDRNNERVAEDYTPDRPVFWQLIADLVRAAAEAGRPLSICGEMAADPRYLARLLALGFESVSVSARHIPGVRRAVRDARRAAELTQPV